MKKLYKRLLAVVLCLALTAAIVPVTAFAEINYEMIPGHRTGDPIPGWIVVDLKEQYYTFDGPYLDLCEILPEIATEIKEYKDGTLGVLLVSLATGSSLEELYEEAPDLFEKVGRHFSVKLKERTLEANARAIELLKDNPYVKRVVSNIYCLADLYVETTVADALDVLRVSAGLVEATDEVVEAYDLDFDGKVTVSDALIVLRIAAKLA